MNLHARIAIACAVVGAVAGAVRCSVANRGTWVAHALGGAAAGFLAGLVVAELAAPTAD